MNRDQAYALVRETFTQSFDKSRFILFMRNLVNHLDEGKAAGMAVPDAFTPHVRSCWRVGTYKSPEAELADVLIVHTTAPHKIERTRTGLRDFVAHKLKRQDSYKEAGLVAFVSPDARTWRFSYVRMEYESKRNPNTGKIMPEERLTPARRFSYIVGEGESCHTAQTRFLGLLQDTTTDPKLADIEDAFSVEAVTKEFFKRYVGLFENIHQSLEKLIKKDDSIRDEFRSKNVNAVDFTKKLMGQIVFLYFLQKKGWLGVAKGQEWGTGPRDFLRRLEKREFGEYNNFFNDILEPLFYDTLATDRGHEAWCNRFKCRIPFLNGGLFEPLGDFDWRKIDIPLLNCLFTNTDFVEEGIRGTGVLDVFDRYNFTVNEAEPLEKEVAIDPEMLGKVFENLIEENRRKGLGAYYTPREIVHYMCQESLINYLDTALNTGEEPILPLKQKQNMMFGEPEPEQMSLRTTTRHERVPREDIVAFVQLGDQASHYEAARMSGTKSYKAELPRSIETHARFIDEKLTDIALCDPAVGSGAFLVGMMTEIVRSRSALTPYFNDVHERTSYHFKRHAIQNCLYGVDIDPGAVEIAKLRLWLSLVVDEEDVKQIKPLPNLDYKVVPGNSLLGLPFKSQRLAVIEQIKQQFFDETDHEKKAKLKSQIDHQLREALSASKKSIGYEVNFDFETFFSEVFRGNGGFDVVIANPPYVRQEKFKEQKPLLKRAYNCYDGRADLYVYFYERGLKLLSEGGVLCFISSNKFLRAGYGEGLRVHLNEQTHLHLLIDFGDLPVFEATSYPCIVAATKRPPVADHEVKTLKICTDDELNRFAEVISCKAVALHQSRFGKGVWHLAGTRALSLLSKIKAAGIALGEIVNGKIYAGIKTGLNDAFIIDKATRNRLIGEDARSKEIIKPFIKGKDIERWVAKTGDRFIIYTPHGIRINEYPAIREHLLSFKSDLQKRALNQKWFELQQPQCAFTRDFETAKIVYPNVALGCRFALDSRSYLDMTAFCLCSSDLSLLGILNSSLMSFYFGHLGIERRGGYQEFKTQYVKSLPIPTTTGTEREEIGSLAERILTTKKNEPGSDASTWEREIDRLVYELYGLTEDEIAIVEAKS